MIIQRFIIVFVSFLTINMSMCIQAQEATYYYHTDVIKGSDERSVLKSVLNTFNDFGYMIEAANQDQGIITGWQFDFDTIPKATRFSGETDKANIMQTIEVKISDNNDGNFNIEMRVIYRKKLVEKVEIYQNFINRLKGNIAL